MKILFDTNVLVSSLVSRGACTDLIKHCARRHTIVSSTYILQELHDTLSRKFKYSPDVTRQAVELMRSRVLWVHPPPAAKPFAPDPDDAMILEAAVVGRCDCLVTGDKDLLALKRYRGIPILAPMDFWRFESTGKMI